jgi:predicted TIM-barrel fold metal-dependent hydrolase
MSTSRFRPSRDVEAIRKRLDHPVLDCDGHFIAFMPLVKDLLAGIGGASMPDRLDRFLAERRVRAFWGFPSENTLDRVTATLPRLMYERLDAFGIDFALLYPTGLAYMSCPDEELRRATVRAFNEYGAGMYASYRDRIEPVAMIPTFSPGEAVEELDYAVGTLGLKTVVMNGVIPRVGGSGRGDGETWLDTLGHGSLHDYDPLWARCLELSVVPAFHGVGYGWGTRDSAENYVFNHLGSFAAAQEAVCRSLVMGGVTRRFPRLPFVFLEGGVTWGVQLYADLLGHYAKRNRQMIHSLDPTRMDPQVCEQLFREFGEGPLNPYQGADRVATAFGWRPTASPDEDVDDFAESDIRSEEDIVDIFTRQLFFGCEADDPMNGLAFDTRFVPRQGTLRAMFASDISHWDVTDMTDVLPEAWELVEDGQLTEEQFGAFAYRNAHELLTAVNPGFFAGTVIGEMAVPR